jgi:hypothetical protein
MNAIANTTRPHRFSTPRRLRESIHRQAGYPFRYRSWEDVPVALRIRILEQVSKALEQIKEAQEE